MTDPTPAEERITERLEGMEQRMDKQWDGLERRRGMQMAAAITESKLTTNGNGHAANLTTSYVWGVVILGAIIALQCLILISQYRLADKQAEADANQREFRDSVVCFVVSTYDIKPGEMPVPDKNVLTRCGFVTVPGN